MPGRCVAGQGVQPNRFLVVFPRQANRLAQYVPAGPSPPVIRTDAKNMENSPIAVRYFFLSDNFVIVLSLLHGDGHRPCQTIPIEKKIQGPFGHIGPNPLPCGIKPFFPPGIPLHAGGFPDNPGIETANSLKILLLHFYQL